MPDTECAILEVPVDYARPQGAKLRLRLGRAPASEPAKRKGVLLLLPGGPGPGIAEMLRNSNLKKGQHHVQTRSNRLLFGDDGIASN